MARNEAAPQELRQIGAAMPAGAWKRFTIKEGAKGPISADFAFVRAVSKRGRRPGDEVWVVFRRSVSDPTEIKYSGANGFCGWFGGKLKTKALPLRPNAALLASLKMRT